MITVWLHGVIRTSYELAPLKDDRPHSPAVAKSIDVASVGKHEPCRALAYDHYDIFVSDSHDRLLDGACCQI